MDNIMIFGARFIIYITFLLMLILSIKGGARERKAMILAFVSLPILILIIKIIHIFFFEPRPFITYNFSPLVDPVGDASFPSVHVSLMAVFAFAYVIFKSKWALLFLTLMLWVGISRIYAGVHYPIDILGGFFVGLVSFLLTRQILRILRAKILG